MNENKVPGIWKWTVVLLVICNAALIATLWLKPQQDAPRNGRGGGHGGPRNYIIEQLKLTDEQVARYDQLIEGHHSTMERLRKEMVVLRKQLFNNIKNAPAGINADSLALEIAKKQEQIEIITYRHFAQVRAEICTDTQKPELDRIIEDVMKQMSGVMRGMPPPNDRDGQGPPHDREGDDHRPHDGHEPPPPGDH